MRKMKGNENGVEVVLPEQIPQHLLNPPKPRRQAIYVPFMFTTSHGATGHGYQILTGIGIPRNAEQLQLVVNLIHQHHPEFGGGPVTLMHPWEIEGVEEKVETS